MTIKNKKLQRKEAWNARGFQNDMKTQVLFLFRTYVPHSTSEAAFLSTQHMIQVPLHIDMA